MENLVRRLGRIFTPKRVMNPPRKGSGPKMDRLAQALQAWVEAKGWRVPTRTIGEAAEQLGTDTATLYHYFDERVGTDFRTWRTRLRLEDACRMLREEPGLQAADIGRRAGFSNRSNFSRQFLAHLGCTPLAWRERARMSHDIQAPENDYV